MATEIRFDHKMSDAEALMWRLDKDPYLSSAFANISILDRAPDIDRLRRRMERAALAIPRLRQRVQPSPANLTPPLWVDDPDFDSHYHLRRLALPAPGSLRQMLDLATL
ncbi:MAG: wax ester/triacylglycerol synthase domain-containing protein, partial [Actinomycetota bacterium]